MFPTWLIFHPTNTTSIRCNWIIAWPSPVAATLGITCRDVNLLHANVSSCTYIVVCSPMLIPNHGNWCVLCTSVVQLMLTVNFCLFLHQQPYSGIYLCVMSCVATLPLCACLRRPFYKFKNSALTLAFCSAVEVKSTAFSKFQVQTISCCT